MGKRSYVRRAFVEVQHPGTVYLFNNDRVWIGPGLGQFRTVRDAKAWGRRNGYVVEHKVRVRTT